MPKPRSAKYTVPASEGRGVPVDDPSKQMIHVKGARVHNLKNIEVQIPHNELVVITGLSGSGKSTLAFDTIFAEGQRRYVESLSAYARQFLGKINKPEVDFITGGRHLDRNLRLPETAFRPDRTHLFACFRA